MTVENWCTKWITHQQVCIFSYRKKYLHLKSQFHQAFYFFLAFIFIGVLFDIGVWYLAKNIQIFEEDTDQKSGKNQKHNREQTADSEMKRWNWWHMLTVEILTRQASRSKTSVEFCKKWKGLWFLESCTFCCILPIIRLWWVKGINSPSFTKRLIDSATKISQNETIV